MDTSNLVISKMNRNVLRKAIFYIGAVVARLKVGELEKIRQIRHPSRPIILTVKKAAGRCCSAQNNNGVSSVIEYPKFGDHNWVKPIP